MASSNVCWGIEVGAGAIKGLCLERDGAEVRVVDFAIVPHQKALSTPDLNQADALRVALGTFFSQKDVSGARVAVSVPGHMAFARFAKLPPVEPKKVPDIVKFEAVQQIPFPIDQVEWDYQTFTSPDSPDVEVGIFAITRERVLERLAMLQELGVTPDCVSLSPVALYNAMAFDLKFTEKTPGTIIVDIGTVSTDLLVADAGRVWIRTFPIGGHNFTEALVSAFKVNYGRAEKLKREVEQSTHKRHMFQAMKGVFEDLAQDIQRSLSYYQQLHPEAKLERLVGLGSTFRLPGLRKFLGQRLQLDVVRLEQFQRIGLEGPAAAEFQAEAITLASAYGCALQGLGLAPIDANLVPVSVVRSAIWKKKTAWFAAAAALSLVGGAAAFVRPMMDARSVPGPQTEATRLVKSVRDEGDRLKSQWDEINSSVKIGHSIANLQRLASERDLVARILRDVGVMLGSTGAQEEFAQGQTPSGPTGEWRIVDLKSLQLTPQVARPGSAPAGGPVRLTIDASMTVDTPNADPGFINSTIVKWLVDNATREGVTYRFVPPDPRTITRNLVSGGEVTQAPAPSGGQGVGLGGGGASGATSAAPTTVSVTPESLDLAAPVPGLAPGFPPSAQVYRHQINWKIEVVDPSAPAGGEAPAGEPAPARRGRGGRSS